MDIPAHIDNAVCPLFSRSRASICAFLTSTCCLLYPIHTNVLNMFKSGLTAETKSKISC